MTKTISKNLLFLLFVGLTWTDLLGQTVIPNFSLKNVDGNSVTLTSYSSKKAIVVIFTSNKCIYSKKYQNRILKLNSDYSAKGVQLILINSNSPELNEAESFEAMKTYAKEMEYKFPYLQDDEQKTISLFSASKNPAAYVLVPTASSFKIVYSGQIDDNPLLEEKVSKKYLATVLDQLLIKGTTDIAPTQPVGCEIKLKEK